MCLMCIEVAKGRMTTSEMKRALPEMISTARTQELLKHYEELNRTDEAGMKKIASLQSESGAQVKATN